MQQIQKDIEQNRFKHFYLLFGDERYLRRQYKNRLQTALCAEGDEMNTHFYSGKDLPVREIIDLAETLPFLAERRVFFISDSGLFKSGGDELADYLKECSETSFFVFSESDVDKRCRLYKTVSAAGYAAEFKSLDEKALKLWIAKTLSENGKKITENTALRLLEKTGTDMDNIRMELEKLICYCMDREVVTDQDVEDICTTRLSNHIFDMIEDISCKRTKHALQLYYDLLALKESPFGILAMISRHCNYLLQARTLRSKGYDNKIIASKLGIHPYAASKYITQSSRFKTSVLKNALEKCAEAEIDVKSGRMNDVMSVELLILTVFGNEK